MPKHESQIVRDEHDENINAKRVSLVSTSTIYAVVNTGAAGDSVANIGFATVAVSTPTLYAVVNTGAAGDSTAKIGFATVAISTPTLYAVVNGGGTQYAEGDLDSTITGTAMMFEIDTNTHELGAVNEFNPIPMYMSESIAAGDNNIGNVDIASIAAGDNNIGDVDIASIAAGVNSIGFATVAVSNIARTITGNITLSDSKGFIGLTTAVLGSAPTLYAVVNTGAAGDSTAKIGFATVNVANTVSITGTVDLGAADNAVLDNIDADLTTIIGHVDGIETLLGTIDADTSNISTKIDTLAGAVAGTEMQVDVATIAAGDNNIGNVDIASIAAGVNSIGFATVAVSNIARTITGNVTLSDSKTYIGLVTATPVGLVTVIQGTSPWASSIIGNLTLSDSKGFIGLVTVANTARSITGNVTLSDAKTYVGLTTTTLGVGNRFIGLVTASSLNAGTTKTIIPKAIALSTGSVSTIAVPTGGTVFKTTNLLLNSSATVRVSIKSGVTYLTGNASIGITLNPGGGWVETGSPDSPTYIGLAADTALVVEKFDMTGTVASISGKINYFLE